MMEKTKIAYFENGVEVTVSICRNYSNVSNDKHIDTGSNYIQVEINDDIYKMNFYEFGAIDKFIRHLGDVVSTNDLAGGIKDIYDYIDSFSREEDFVGWKYYVIEF